MKIWLTSFFSKKCKKCFFLQNKNCVVDGHSILPCDMKVKKIVGIGDIEFYINMVNSKKLSIRALYFSLLSLIISIVGIFINYLKLIS